MKPHFSSVACAFAVLFRVESSVMKVYPFSSIVCSFSSHVFRPSTFVFVNSMRWEGPTSFLCMWICTCPSITCLRNSSSFPIGWSWDPCQDNLMVNVWAYFWMLKSVPLTCLFWCQCHTVSITLYCLVALREVLKLRSVSSPHFFLQNCFEYSGSLKIPY